MKTSILYSCICFFAFHTGLIAQDIVGFWKTIDDKTGKPQSIIGVYEYKGEYYGRIIETYDDKGKIQDHIYAPQERAPGVEGDPFYAGLDIIWGLKKNGEKYTKGKILDPEKGRIYDAAMWRQGNNLIVRGELWVFGANQEWLPATNADFPPGFEKPDLNKLEPSIPQPKKKRTSPKQPKKFICI